MKAIDYIVDFIFDKIFRTSTLEVLQPPKPVKSLYQKLKESLIKEMAERNARQENKPNASTLSSSPNKIRSILKNSPEKKKPSLNVRDNNRKKSIRLKENSVITPKKENSRENININEYTTPKFIQDLDIVQQKNVEKNNLNNQDTKKRGRVVRISDNFEEINQKDSIIHVSGKINDKKNLELFVRHPDNLEEEKKEDDLNSIVKTLKKKYDTTSQSRKSGRSMSLKDMIFKTKTQTTTISPITPSTSYT